MLRPSRLPAPHTAGTAVHAEIDGSAAYRTVTLAVVQPVMLQISPGEFAILAAAAVTLLFLLWLPPQLRLPALGLVFLVGLGVGSSGLGWVGTDLPIKALAAMMLVVVLVFAGSENGFDTGGGDARRPS